MGYKWVTLEGASGSRSFKISTGEKLYIYDASGSSLGTARTMEDAIAIMKAAYGARTWNIKIGEEHSSCFPANTLVSTPRGPVRIAELRPYDVVWSVDGDKLLPAVVTRLVEHDATQLWDVVIVSREQTVRTTASHSFLTERGWVSTADLRSGDALLDERGTTHSVVRVTPTEHFEFVFNLHTTGTHTYIADGLIVHNFTMWRTLRTLLHRFVVDPWYHRSQQSRLIGDR